MADSGQNISLPYIEIQQENQDQTNSIENNEESNLKSLQNTDKPVEIELREYKGQDEQEQRNLQNEPDPQILPQKNKNIFARFYHKICVNQENSGSLQLIIDFWFLTLTLLGTMYLIWSIKDCPAESEQACSKFVQELLNTEIKIYLVITFEYGLTIFLYLTGNLNKKIGIATIILVVYISLFYDTKITMSHYGGAITAFAGIFTVVWALFLFFLLLLYKIYQQSKILLLFLLVLVGSLTYYQINYSCGSWSLGIEGQSLDRDPLYCHLIEPKYCPITVLDNFLDLSSLINLKCENHKGNKEIYKTYFTSFNTTTRYVGFPLSKDFQQDERLCYVAKIYRFQQNILSRAFPVSSPEQAFERGAQYVLDLEEMKYNLTIKRNESLVKERLENKWINSSLSQNVIIVFLDAISRSQFQRTMKKTAQWIEQRSKTKKTQNFQLFRFYSNRDQTYPNFQTFQYENYALKNTILQKRQFPCESSKLIQYDSTKFDKQQKTNFIDFSQYDPECVQKFQQFNDPRIFQHQFIHINQFQQQHRNIFSKLREAGFVIGRSANMCVPNSANMMDGDNNRYYDEPADHEGVVPACDPHHQDPVSPYQIFTGPYSVLQRCLNGMSVSEHTLEYGKKFWEAYSGDSQFLLMEFLDGHEPTGTVIKHLDEPLLRFFEGLEQKQLLNDTLIVLMSDHGNHWHLVSLQGFSQQEATERMNPMLIVNFPTQFVEKYPEKMQNLKNNQQQLFGFKNLHFFVQTWIQGFQYPHAEKSFFSEKFNPSYKCDYAVDDFEQFVQQQYLYRDLCVCIGPNDTYPNRKPKF